FAPELDPEVSSYPLAPLAVGHAAFDDEQVPRAAPLPLLVVVPLSALRPGDLDCDAAVGSKAKLALRRELFIWFAQDRRRDVCDKWAQIGACAGQSGRSAHSQSLSRWGTPRLG